MLKSLPVSLGMGESRIGVGKDVRLEELLGVEQKPGITIRSKTIVLQQVKILVIKNKVSVVRNGERICFQVVSSSGISRIYLNFGGT